MSTRSAAARLFPFLRWPRPSPASLKADIWAGISVGLVLIPQALAYATLAGMPPHTGLYAAMLPTVVGLLWGSSALLAVGPVALTSILVFGSLSSLASPGSAEWVALAIWLAVYSGLIQFLLGAFRLGKAAFLVSQPVVLGFINAAAVIIILSQLPHLLGIEVKSRDAAEIANQLLMPSSRTLMTAAFGCTALLLLFGFKRFFPRLPGILVVTVVGIAASKALDYASYGGAIVGALPAGLPALALPPAISFDSHRELWPAALILAVISFTEAMSSCRVLARKTNEQWDENQELIGQGLAKITSGFVGAFPVSGSFSRSALNLYAGATSAWASLIAALCVLLSLLFLTGFVFYLPYSVLAAMIVVPVLNLIDIAGLRRLFRISRDDAWVAAVTFVVTLTFTPKLHYGVFAGLGLTMVSFLYRRTHPRIIEVGRHGDGTLRDRQRFDLPPLAPDVLAVRMDSALNFLTAATLERFINDRLNSGRVVRRILLGASGINDIDASGVEMLESLEQTLRGQGVELYLSNVKKQVWDVLDRASLIQAIGTERIFATDTEAIEVMTLTSPPHHKMAESSVVRQ
ncbi:SulP family inorganic anion transporter [Noviherbaspirillum sp. Root189]|uniref:SulP family inorganic anion transporter n=1 Tax=Noviherbaspirillum sp. Root189 TaxID=1736487 RepID=UPI00070DC402|nr:SulP family inorganic anion transporter [Noviherbaspirillum sp. Root189]KRB87391.1 sulfate transporter [Noviherbaspirillum sp. Root189]